MSNKFQLYLDLIIASFSNNRLQYMVFMCLSLGVLGFIGILYYSNSLIFQRFLGRINPVAAFLFAILIGFMLLATLLSREWFAIYERENLISVIRYFGLAALFGVIIILVDIKVVFRQDMNILFPESLLYYPAMGFLAEILFHVLPLTVLLVTLNSILKDQSFNNIVLICIFIVALLEAIFQAMHMYSENQFPLWSVIFVGLHVYLISTVQLLIFKQYDFISMYLFRLVYYSFWHIGWGYFRLQLLF